MQSSGRRAFKPFCPIHRDLARNWQVAPAILAAEKASGGAPFGRGGAGAAAVATRTSSAAFPLSSPSALPVPRTPPPGFSRQLQAPHHNEAFPPQQASLPGQGLKQLKQRGSFLGSEEGGGLAGGLASALTSSAAGIGSLLALAGGGDGGGEGGGDGGGAESLAAFLESAQVIIDKPVDRVQATTSVEC